MPEGGSREEMIPLRADVPYRRTCPGTTLESSDRVRQVLLVVDAVERMRDQRQGAAAGFVAHLSLSAAIARAGRPLAVAIMVVVLLAGCAAGANPQVDTMGDGDVLAGFWLGLWHGVIAPVTFVISLLNAEVGVYEVHNTGAWYDFGFVLGLGFLVGGGSSGARTAKR